MRFLLMETEEHEREQMMKAHKRRKRPAKPRWELRLYVADTTPRSVLAQANLRSFCEKDLRGNCRIAVIDIVCEPEQARKNEILATPTLVRVLPQPKKVLIGSLSDAQRVIRALELGDEGQEAAMWLASRGASAGTA